METLHPSITLPGKLAEIVPAERIAENERRFLDSAPEVDPAALEEAKLRLSQLYLIHATDQGSYLSGGMVPHAQHTYPSDFIGYTFDFDKSLDLDKCIFFSWPLPPEVYEKHAKYMLLISPSILEDERCFVTPSDIREVPDIDTDELGNPVVFADGDQSPERERLADAHEYILDGTYDELINPTYPMELYDGTLTDEEASVIRQRVIGQLKNNYMDKIVSGKVWLEYVARMLIAHGPDGVPRGEIKFNGRVSSGEIVGRVTTDEFNETYRPFVEEVLEGSSAK